MILGTLGRQGSPKVLSHIESLLRKRGTPYIVLLLSEIFPSKLQQFGDVEAYVFCPLSRILRQANTFVNSWVQIACPRLSIDWGSAFSCPLLNPYEAEVAFGSQEWLEIYPMDYYAKDGGPWSVYHSDKANASASSRRAVGVQTTKQVKAM